MKTSDLLNSVEKLQVAAADTVSKLIELKQRRDPVAAFIFTARAQWRGAADRMKKSDKDLTYTLETTYRDACQLYGYKGSVHEWERVMLMHPRRD